MDLMPGDFVSFEDRDGQFFLRKLAVVPVSPREAA
jgi:hypothetical protein